MKKQQGLASVLLDVYCFFAVVICIKHSAAFTSNPFCKTIREEGCAFLVSTVESAIAKGFGRWPCHVSLPHQTNLAEWLY